MEFQYLSFLGLDFGRSSLISLFILSLRQNSFAWPLEALLWWGSCVKVWTLMIYRRRKFFKLHWLKYPKTVPQSEIWTRKPQIMIQSLQKSGKKDRSSQNTASLKKPQSFCEPRLTQHCKKYTSATQPKTLLTFQIFQR